MQKINYENISLGDFAISQNIDLDDLLEFITTRSQVQVYPDTTFGDISLHLHGQIGIFAWALKED